MIVTELLLIVSQNWDMSIETPRYVEIANLFCRCWKFRIQEFSIVHVVFMCLLLIFGWPQIQYIYCHLLNFFAILKFWKFHHTWTLHICLGWKRGNQTPKAPGTKQLCCAVNCQPISLFRCLFRIVFVGFAIAHQTGLTCRHCSEGARFLQSLVQKALCKQRLHEIHKYVLERFVANQDIKDINILVLFNNECIGVPTKHWHYHCFR